MHPIFEHTHDKRGHGPRLYPTKKDTPTWILSIAPPVSRQEKFSGLHDLVDLEKSVADPSEEVQLRYSFPHEF
jgi:hypothetical protein